MLLLCVSDYSGLHPLSCSGSVQSVHSITVTMNALYEDNVIILWIFTMAHYRCFQSFNFDIEGLVIPMSGKVWFMTICIPICDISMLSEEHERLTNC